MVSPPTPADEPQRLEALHNLRQLDTPPDPQLDRITRLACTAANTPMALICFVDAQRQWFKSRQGVGLTETPREYSFCAHAILQKEPMIVADTKLDARFVDNPLVTGEPNIRFYAGHSIHAPQGGRVGTLCVLDTRPRELSPQQLDALVDLAALVDAQFAAQRLTIATRSAGIGLFERPVDAGEIWWSDAMWEIYGQDPATFRPTYEGCMALLHPEDRDRLRADARSYEKPGAAVSLQYRIVRPDGSIRHLQSIASTSEGLPGSRVRVAGITLDVTERAESERREHRQQQQMRESSHQAGMAEIATDVVHTVGNLVNSLGIANTTVRRSLKALRLEQLEQAATLISDNRATLNCFLTENDRGRYLPDYLTALSAQISTEVRAVQAELDATDGLLEELRDVISAQQARAQVGSLREPVDLQELIDATLGEQALETSNIEVVRRYENMPPVTTDRYKLKLILLNYLSNARDAVLASTTLPRRIMVQLSRETDHAVILVEDSGVGMSSDVVSHLWRFGFTTKARGQGFDLHNSANAAREIGATIAAHSDGPSKGSRFIIRLPIVKSDAAVVEVSDSTAS